MPKISVIVPVYNTENYLAKCIESILSQTESNFELLLIDDGSNDDSGKICDEYALKDSRIKVFHKENAGVSAARNLGLDMAIGKMVFFIDSDDYIGPDYLKTLMIIGDEDFVQSGVQILESDYLKPVMTHEEIYSDYNLFWRDSRQQWAPMCCLSKKIIDEYHLRYETTLKLGEDGLFNHLFISKCRKIRRIVFNQYYYNNENELSASHKFYLNRLEQQVNLIKKMEQFLPGDQLWRVKWDYWHEVLNHYQVKGINSHDPKMRKLAKKKIKETYQCKDFRNCIPYIQRAGSLDEKIESHLMTYHRHMFFIPLLKGIQLLACLKR